MINKNNIQYDFDDLIIEASFQTNIKSRKTINVRENNYLPLITAPMDTVIDENNYQLFENLGILPILPRKSVLDTYSTQTFLSYSLEQVENVFLMNDLKVEDKPFLVLIDVANGHMQNLMKISYDLKNKYGDNIKLMVGNVSNPTTVDTYCKIGVDYIRLGVGNGNACTTSANTAIGASMVYLIDESYKLRNKFYTDKTKLIADGGMKKYSDIIKSLALGADYVMIGSLFNKALESCSITTKTDGTVINQYDDEAKKMLESGIDLYKEYRGMSTKVVQKSLGKEKLTTSEGIVTQNKVLYTLSSWVENFEDYLKSTMSYTNSENLEEFKGKVTLNLISDKAFNRFNK